MLTKHSAADVVLGLVLVAVLVPIALIDFEHRIIPNKITLPAAVAAVAIGAALDLAGVPEQLIAGAAAGGFLLAFLLAYPRGMGMGDVKLAAVLGLFLGRSVAVAILVGVLTATLVGAVVMARVGVEKGRKTAVPFGPFLALGGVIGLLAGPRSSTGTCTPDSDARRDRPGTRADGVSRRLRRGHRRADRGARADADCTTAGARRCRRRQAIRAALRDPARQADPVGLALEPRGRGPDRPDARAGELLRGGQDRRRGRA